MPTIVGAKVLTSQEPLRLLRQIAARKVIVIDACRSRARLPTDRPFSPEMVRTEVERQSLDTIKCWMGWTHFLCTTLPKVPTEMALNVLAYNMKRVIAILGVRALVDAMRA